MIKRSNANGRLITWAEWWEKDERKDAVSLSFRINIRLANILYRTRKAENGFLFCNQKAAATADDN